MITVETKVLPAFISKWTAVPIFYIEVPGLCGCKFVHFHGRSQQAKRFLRLLLCCSYNLISLSLCTKGRNCKCYTRQERCYVFADLKPWLPCASASCVRVFNIRSRSRVMNEHYWPCMLTINLVSCIMHRDLTVQKLPAPHLQHNPIILKVLRG